MKLWNMRPKALLAAVLVVVLSIGTVAPKTQAATTNLLSGQKQYYTVMMRADKQSLVYAKVTFENPSATEDLQTFSFTLPDDVAVSNLSVQQILAQKTTKTCKTYESYDTYKSRVSYSYQQTQYYYEQNKLCTAYDETSAYDEDYDFDANMSSSTAYYYYDYYLNRLSDSTFKYEDLSPEQSGQTYTVTLPTAIHPKKQGAILVAYTSKSYITGSLGRYTYDFRTFTAKELVSKAVVAINLDDELYSTLTSSTRQVSTSTANSASGLTTSTDSAAYESKTVDDIQTGVGRGGRYVKEKSQLLPGETFSVKGAFATNQFALFAPTILRSVLVVLFIGSGVWFGYRLWRVKHPKGRKTSPGTSKSESASEPSTTESSLVVDLTTKQTAFVSLVSIVVSGLIVVAAFWSAAVAYNSTFITLVVLFVIPLVIMTLFVLPFIHVLLTYGLRGAYRWLLYHVAILLAIFVIIIGLYAIFHQTAIYPI